jgi:uncharacterized protein (TIGR02569 family)
MAKPVPDQHVLSEFGVTQDLIPIAGGSTGGCYRAGDLVLKPGQDEDVIGWIGGLAMAVTPNPEFRLAAPIKSRSGAWTVSGWSATTFVEGDHERGGRWAQVIEAARALHRAIEHIPRPPFLDRRTDPWYFADRAVWGEIEVAIPEQLGEQVGMLSAMLEPVDLASQVIHSDLCGNTLVHERLPLAVIDFSALYRPAQYAEAILISDAVIWESAPMNVAEQWATDGMRLQMLVRSCLFRLYVAAISWPDMPDRLTLISQHHAAMTEWLWACRRCP